MRNQLISVLLIGYSWFREKFLCPRGHHRIRVPIPPAEHFGAYQCMDCQAELTGKIIHWTKEIDSVPENDRFAHFFESEYPASTDEYFKEQ